MYRGEGYLSGFYFGFDLERLYLRLDPIWRKAESLQGLDIHIHFSQPREWEIIFPLRFAPGKKAFYDLYARDGEGLSPKEHFTQIESGKIVELSIPFRVLQFSPREKAQFFIQVQRRDLAAERYPRNGFLSFFVPDQDFELVHWQV
jgi:hypothetical protein